MRLLRNQLVVLLCIVLSGCAANMTYSEPYRQAALIVPQEQRVKLHKKIRSITMIVNVSPRMSPGVPASYPVDNFIANIKHEIEQNGIQVKEIVYLNNQQELVDTSKGNALKIREANLTDSQMFEKYITPAISTEAAFVLLLDSCCPGTAELSDENKYLAIAYSILVNGKRTDALGTTLNLATLKNDVAGGMFVATLQSAQVASELSDNEYKPLFTRLTKLLNIYIGETLQTVKNNQGN